ncbi:MAG: tRNA pseudouridine(38-40) synthase TruA [Gammaproteobacteria bacterium]|nr:tRNA pseudouridine(38-40) synthase TruA [Gammaproteobacteria bacterium]
MRIACGIEYDGSAYHGWQRQQNAVSIQQVVEGALSKVANQSIEVICAGRTDSGVHATGQVIHFDTTAERDAHAWMLGTNSNLPKDVSVSWAQPVSNDFHARFKAVERSYRYIVLNRYTRSALLHKRVTWWLHPVEVERMQVAAQYLLGEHDFSSFRAVNCQAKTPVRTLHELKIHAQGHVIYMDLRADGFLYHMVRNIAGVLLKIGTGEKPLDWTQTVLEAKNRTQGGITAPAQGLYLTDVRYPDEFSIPRSGYKPVYGDILAN